MVGSKRGSVTGSHVGFKIGRGREWDDERVPGLGRSSGFFERGVGVVTSIRDLIERLEELAEQQGMAALVYVGVRESNEMISLGVVDIPSGGDQVLLRAI